MLNSKDSEFLNASELVDRFIKREQHDVFASFLVTVSQYAGTCCMKHTGLVYFTKQQLLARHRKLENILFKYYLNLINHECDHRHFNGAYDLMTISGKYYLALMYTQKEMEKRNILYIPWNKII